MKVTVETVEHIAKLAKLTFSDTDKTQMAHELGDILGYIEKLNELNTDGVEPLSHPIDIVNVMREDKAGESFPPEVAVRNAPSPQDTFFKVPKVIK
ncbi:MAG: Asp-tRNA(Asn)/Glu-tRNA(Gln) amidotransferase subunit GatC [Calditrichia bacterium]